MIDITEIQESGSLTETPKVKLSFEIKGYVDLSKIDFNGTSNLAPIPALDDFESKITDLDMEYFFYKACEAIHRVLITGHFTLQESEENLKQKFKVRQSSINKWCQLEYITTEILLNKGLKSIYQDYKLWCGLCGYGPFNYGNFVESIIKQYKLTTIYDRGLNDQVVVSSLLPVTFCPFDQSLNDSYN